MNDDERRALEDERAFLLQSLRDLEAEHAAGDLADADHAALRDEYTAKAAAVLRQLETAPQPGFRTVERPLGGSTVRKGRRGRVVAAVLALALVSGGAGYAVAQSSGERLAGDEATGDLPEGSVDRITKANALASEGEILEAVKVYDDLLEDDPENPVALAERGWLVSRVDPSLVDSGLASVERAIAVDPNYPDAHFFRGMILWKGKGQPAQAVESLQRALDLDPPPDFRGLMQQQLDAARADAAGETSATP